MVVSIHIQIQQVHVRQQLCRYTKKLQKSKFESGLCLASENVETKSSSSLAGSSVDVRIIPANIWAKLTSIFSSE